MNITNKRILVFGGAGSIGSELVRQLAPKNKVYVVDINESGLFDLTDSIQSDTLWGRVGDVRDRLTVKEVFEDFKPQIVFNAAAYKHVPLMEYTPQEAINTNVNGHLNVVQIAKTWECVEKLIYISTDKVVSSHSIMGATKLLGERITINQGYTAVRFGNVMNSRGSLLKIWQRQVDSGENITVTDKRMERFMMTIPEAVSLILKAASESRGGDVWIMDMGEKVNIYELAKEIVKGKDIDIEVTGLRQGETLTEDIMTAEERERAILKDNFYVI